MRRAISAGSVAFLLLALSHGGEAGVITGRVKAKWIEEPRVVVVLQSAPGSKGADPAERPVMTQKDKPFVPRILPVVVGTTVEFRNSDPFKHNIFAPDGQRYNLGTWGEGKGRSYPFRRSGVYR